MKRILGILTLMVMVCSAYAPVYAGNDVTVAFESNKYIISGTFEDARFNSSAVIIVKDENGSVVHYDGIKTDLSGGFDYSFVMPDNAGTGEYTFYISGYDSGEMQQLSMNGKSVITYIDPDDINIALQEVDNSGNNTKEVIEDNLKELRIFYNQYYQYYVSLSDKSGKGKENIAKAVHDNIPYGTDIVKFDGIFYKALAMESLKEGTPEKIEEILSDFSDYYSVEDAETYSLFETLDSYKTEVYTKFSVMLTGYENFEESFNNAVILTNIHNANTWGEVSETLKKYSSILPFEIESGQYGAVSKAVVGKNYENMTSLKKAVKNAVNSGSGSGSGSGRGSGSGSSSDSAVLGYVPTISNPPLSSDTDSSEIISSFSDIYEAEWAKPAISFLSDKGIISGKGDGKVYPNETITREQFVKMILVAFDIYNEGSDANFADVPADNWAYSYIACAVDKEIVNGISNTHFGMGSAISRQDMAVLITRAMTAANKLSVPEDLEVNFNDNETLADYAKPSVAYLVAKGAINGFDDGSFRGGDSATRAQAAQILYSILK